MGRRMEKFFTTLALACFILLPFPGELPAWDVVVTSPWLEAITSFIGGVSVEVRSLYGWDQNGAVVRRMKASAVHKDRRIIALDAEEAKKLGLLSSERQNLALLYRKVPRDASREDSFFSDPSILPFLAQRVFTALSGFDPENYPYYQRRLSEFQTRLDSTVFVGRQLLKGLPILDLTGEFSGMLVAAGCDLSLWNEKQRASWRRGEDMKGLAEAVAQAINRTIPVVLDTVTPKAIRDTLKNEKNLVVIGRPLEGQDLLLFLHDQYLLLWNKLAPYRQNHQGRV